MTCRDCKLETSVPHKTFEECIRELRSVADKAHEAVNSAIGCLHVIGAEARVIANNSDPGSRAHTLAYAIIDYRSKAHEILVKAQKATQ